MCDASASPVTGVCSVRFPKSIFSMTTRNVINFGVLAGYPTASALCSNRTLPVLAWITSAPRYGLREIGSEPFAPISEERTERDKIKKAERNWEKDMAEKRITQRHFDFAAAQLISRRFRPNFSSSQRPWVDWI